MPRPHPPEFRRRAVELAREKAKPTSALAHDLGISESCETGWPSPRWTGAFVSGFRGNSPPPSSGSTLARESERFTMDPGCCSDSGHRDSSIGIEFDIGYVAYTFYTYWGWTWGAVFLAHSGAPSGTCTPDSGLRPARIGTTTESYGAYLSGTTTTTGAGITLAGCRIRNKNSTSAIKIGMAITTASIHRLTRTSTSTTTARCISTGTLPNELEERLASW